MSAKIDAPAIIAEYRAAYLRANGRETIDEITYDHGWFVFRRHYIIDRQRAAQMRKMTERLNARWEIRDRAYVEDAAMREDKQ